MIKKFKYLFIIFILLLIPSISMSTDYPLTFAWTQEGEVEGWELFMASDSTMPFRPVLDAEGNPIRILRDSTPLVDGEYQSDQSFQITGEPGESITWFFKIRAFKGDIFSSLSPEEVSYTFIIPLATPHLLRITVSVVPN